MKQVIGLTSTYSSDEFGVCSALYELGGMVVMHDASGCNSTYTTHDEPRWYDMDSMVYISAISEMEAVMGDDEKLIRDLAETAGKLRPAFIAIVGAPIPYMIGTDFKAIASLVEQETGIPSFGFAANGMHSYLEGISMALESIAGRFCIQEAEKTDALSVNILGATPLDFSLNGSVESIRQWLSSQGMQVGACMAMGSTLEEIKRAGQAHVNLVVSSGGLAAAALLEKRFGTPYVAGVPLGREFARRLAGTLRQAAECGKNAIGYRKESCHTVTDARKGTLALVGESVYMGSLAAAIELETGIPAQVLCPLETEEALLREGGIRTPEEDDLLGLLPKYQMVVADPLYQPLCADGTAFYPLAHEAFSGRLYTSAGQGFPSGGKNAGGRFGSVDLDLVNRELCLNDTRGRKYVPK